jgi:DNA-binding SARP family transcriptional activator
MKFSILGTLEVRIDGARIQLHGKRQHTVLAALLLARGETVSLGRLVDSVWNDDTAPSTAAKQVRNIVSDLRRQRPELAHAIETVIPGYRLMVDDECLDSAVFTDRVGRAHALVAAGQLADARRELRAALTLWRGAALSGIESIAVQSRAVVLNEQRLTVVEEWVDLELAAGSVDSFMISLLLDLLEENPYRERLTGLLMLALYRLGAQSRALAVFQRIRATMLDELGVEPGPGLQEIHDRIRAQAVQAPLPRAADNHAATSSALPTHIDQLISHTELLNQISADLASTVRNAPNILAIDGMAGVGKTKFAIHLAQRIAHHYPDGQFFAEFNAHSSNSTAVGIGSMLDRMLRAINIADDHIPDSVTERAALWRNELAQRSLIIVLDDAAGSSQVRSLIAPSSTSLTIVTSRQRLSGIDLAQTLTLDTISPAAGRELFTQIVGDERPLLDPDSVEAIVEHCGYLPLAIRIAAARIRHRPIWALSEFVRHIEADASRVIDLRAESQSVTTAFESSYRRLPADHRHLFRSLADVADINLRSAAHAADIPAACTEQLLEQLVDANLLQPSRPGQYQMHRLLRTYAAKVAESRPEVPPLRIADPTESLCRAI